MEFTGKTVDGKVKPKAADVDYEAVNILEEIVTNRINPFPSIETPDTVLLYHRPIITEARSQGCSDQTIEAEATPVTTSASPISYLVPSFIAFHQTTHRLIHQYLISMIPYLPYPLFSVV